VVLTAAFAKADVVRQDLRVRTRVPERPRRLGDRRTPDRRGAAVDGERAVRHV